MAIQVVNSTNAAGLEFFIVGYTNGSGTTIPGASGSLTPSGQEGSSISMSVSGYESYGVGYWSVGWLPNDQMAVAMSPEVTDDTIVELAINVMAN
ncbi:MAG TPA: hypothetical protein PLD20_31905 [Blastocatellia bacterium]|nr:hypothetical protein [Blastocatellia bacterium]HMV84453.1 hypothetical protein [Blastocatellia bacterium]HMY76688.1 hypothetical protein [Blastocatellia bacterium]HMZ22578.1 hypothetical protein [Blastocatellia bacterium]HNG34237.1 hypothetical protein [Blastocatellia bacterium]